ncbi:MAG: hypothetical protein Ta2A_03690 [Treponemataceae bacterium]|nr:MAG: hypothetical protein Ta2A_03690 [Treponemataceae bacterium]
MTKTTAVRQELHTFLDEIPDSNVYALKPLLSMLAGQSFTIETNLTEEEQAIIAAGDKQFKEHPETFVPLESIA